MPDHFENCHSVPRELIFRYCSVSTQINIARAYRDTPQAHAVEEFKYHQESVHCWTCICAIFLELFWPSAIDFDQENGGIQFGVMRCEPSHNTTGFKLLYKLSRFEERETYKLRDFVDKKDAEDADAILKDFITQANNVFKARSKQEMQDHISFAHDGIGNFPQKFFNVLVAHEGIFYILYFNIYFISKYIYVKVLTLYFQAYITRSVPHARSNLQQNLVRLKMEKVHGEIEFLENQLNRASKKLMNTLSRMWKVGGSIDMVHTYNGGSKALLIWTTFCKLLFFEEKRVENKLCDARSGHNFGACE